MLLGMLLPIALLCIGTQIVQVNYDADGNVQLVFSRTQAQEFKPDDTNCQASLFSSYRWKKFPKIPHKNSKIAPLAYLCLLTISLSADVEQNPGPDYPCGCCGSEVLDTDMAIECDNCCNWFHISCQGIGDNTYHSLTLESSFSWICSICSELNFSHSTSSMASVTTLNNFSVLSEEPSHISGTQTTNIGHSKTQKVIKILNVNCRSVVNKKAELFSLMNCHNPDIVIGTESWLTSNHLDRKVQVGKDQEKAQSEKDSHSKNRGGKKPN